MISGNVNSLGDEARITIAVRGPTGRTLRLKAVVDTGFTNCLTLPEHQIGELKLPWRGTVGATLADNKPTDADVYRGDIMWDGKPKTILIAALETTSLVGMKLMENYRLSIDVVPGGLLRLDPIAATH